MRPLYEWSLFVFVQRTLKKKGIKVFSRKYKCFTTKIPYWINMRNYPTIDKGFKLPKLLNVKVDDLYEEDVE